MAAVKEPGLAAMVVPDGVDYEAFDGSLANLIFMIAAPEGEADVHLEALSRLSTLLMDPDFKNDLIHAESKEEFLQLIDDKESERYEKKVRKEEKIAEDAAPRSGAFKERSRIPCPRSNRVSYRHRPHLYGG